ncbi:MAG: hypothetical protein AB1758_37320, partial [Candidatus Eremiobacterota bacterium]
MPGKPSTTVESRGGLTFHTHTLQMEWGRYLVGWNDFPREALSGDPAAFLHEFTRGMADEELKVVKDEAVKVGQFAAHDLNADGPQGSVRSRFILVGTRLYVITVGGDPAHVNDEGARFIDSFQVL